MIYFLTAIRQECCDQKTTGNGINIGWIGCAAMLDVQCGFRAEYTFCFAHPNEVPLPLVLTDQAGRGL
jgi:hypothetical protein